MNKICIIGNSHMGNLKIVYDNQNRQGIDLYASGGSKLSSLYLKDKKLLTEDIETKNDLKRTNGDEFISLEKYSHILIYGCGILSPGFVEYYSSVLSKKYSENCLVQAYIDKIDRTLGIKLAKMIKESNICQRVTVVPSPLISEAHPLVDEKLISASTPTLARQTLDKVELIYKNYLHEYAINLLWNPRELLSNNGFTTDIKYKRNLNDDVSHLNVLGGKLVLDHIYNYLGM